MDPSLPLVLILDDDTSVRRALARLLRSAGFEACTFASAAEFLENGLETEPACLVVDVRMPGQSGLDLQETLSAAGWDVPIVFISGHADVPTSVLAMRRGAVHFLEKPFDDETILGAIREAAERGRLTRRERRRRDEVARLVETLTPREREVFTLVVAGYPNKKIANRLGASEKTIKVHRGRVMGKMRAGSLADLVHMAHDGGLGEHELGAGFLQPALTPAPTIGPRSDSFLFGASEMFARQETQDQQSPGEERWRWSRAPRSSRSSGSS
jgi:FixJ family two-component response regulator